MESKEFKDTFSEIAKKYDFKKAFSGWFIESGECIIVLDLQKSNFGNLYYLNIKIFVQGFFENSYIKSKNLVKKDVGDIFRRQPKEYNDVFDFDKLIDDEKRKQKLKELFEEFIVPFTNKALTKAGIKELADKGEVFLLPAVKEEFDK